MTYAAAPHAAHAYSTAPVTYAAPATYAAPPMTYTAAPVVQAAPVSYTQYAALGHHIDWAAVNAALPYEKTPESKAKRNKLFRAIDVNGNDYLSLAEVDKGLRDNVHLLNLFDCKPAIMRAFQAAKNYGGDPTGVGVDYVEKREFRILLQYLRSYFELYEMYSMVDKNSDRHVTKDEFCACGPMLESWGVKLEHDEAGLADIFAQIDKDNGGVILFSEFADWAIANKLDLGEEDNRPVQGPAGANDPSYQAHTGPM